MAKQKKKLSPSQKAAKKKVPKQEYVTIFMNGKQKRIKRPVLVDGMHVEEFIRTNADPVWLHQNELWEYIDLPEEDDLIMNCAKKV
jgi:16S rRNA U516 pseudouridylate synthase RsuA-like enzyme